MKNKVLFNNWNRATRRLGIEIEDDTIRDGLQGSSLKSLRTTEKIKLLKMIVDVGVSHIVVGFPATSKKNFEECIKIILWLKKYAPRVQPWCLARLEIMDIWKIEEIKKVTDSNLGICLFAPTSRAHFYIKKIEQNAFVKQLRMVLDRINSAQLKFSFNFEDGTRTSPTYLKRIIRIVLPYSPYSLAICDTAGASHPSGVKRLVSLFLSEIKKSRKKVKLLWHGHNDKGLAMANVVQAIESGVNIISGSFFGYGERAGNVANEQVAYFLNEAYGCQYNLKNLNAMSVFIQKKTGGYLSHNHPFVGDQVFSTSTGVHGSAMVKAMENHSKRVSDLIYCDVNSDFINTEHQMLMGPNGGRKTLSYLLKKLKINLNQESFELLFNKCKSKRRALSLMELEVLANKIRAKK